MGVTVLQLNFIVRHWQSPSLFFWFFLNNLNIIKCLALRIWSSDIVCQLLSYTTQIQDRFLRKGRGASVPIGLFQNIHWLIIAYLLDCKSFEDKMVLLCYSFTFNLYFICYKINTCSCKKMKTNSRSILRYICSDHSSYQNSNIYHYSLQHFPMFYEITFYIVLNLL